MGPHAAPPPDAPSPPPRLAALDNGAPTPEAYAAFRAFIARRVPDPALAEDILQNSLVKAIDAAAWSDKDNPVAWFYRVLRNAIADHYRANAVTAKRRERYEAEQTAGETSTAHQAHETHEETCACFRTVLPALRPEYAEALRLVDLEAVPPRDAAARLGISAGNLNVRLHRARTALRERLKAVCGTCSARGCFNCRCGHDAQKNHAPVRPGV